MSGLGALALALGAGLVVLFVVLLWAAVSHAAWLIHQERQAKGIELQPTPERTRLGIRTKTRPRRSHDRPHDH